MKKHLVAGVLGLTMLLVVVSTPVVSAGEGRVGRNASGECCVLVDGACVPCDKMASTRATCDPGQCKTMTPEQCNAQGCEPAECRKTSAISSSARVQSAGACLSGPDCKSASNCATKSRCGGGGCAMQMVKVQDAMTGEVTYRLVPVATQTTLSKSEVAKPGTGI